jgi:hypothetical protein
MKGNIMNEQDIAVPKEPQWIWGLKNIGQVVGLNYEGAKHLIRIGVLTPHKIRRRYVMTAAEIHQQLSGVPK